MTGNKNKEAKTFDNKVSQLTMPKNDSKVPKTLWHSNNIHYIIKCNNCMKPRLISVLRLPTENINQRIQELKVFLKDPGYDYICGDK